ncbi:MAG: hypothetical protein KKG99_02255 [Bacteroidetes bacterium]|nr:hypothetical protein [Bacteroidota bacterium]
MKTLKSILVTIVLLLVTATTQAQEKEFPKLTGPYLGQKPPGMIPEIFAPDLISSTNHSECCRAISKDGREIFFVRKLESEEKIFIMKDNGNGWSKPEQILYTNKSFQYTPFISPKGDKLIFMAGNSRPGRGKNDSLPEVYLLSRKDKEWEISNILGATIGEAQPFYITMAENGNLYFSCMDRYGIYRSEYRDGNYLKAEKLPDEINRLNKPSHPYIAPDESYIMFQSRDVLTNNVDLYICFLKKDGNWSGAINMGDKINTSKNEVCPSVSNDGKYMFFGRLIQGEDADIYWVSSKIIEELRPKN